ncbi:MPN396 family protein [Mycoplasmoides genitalium]|uniref:MPN396 family protein n=1 Tax=Mycoplasmoides genitalium TaxID=2097 RepID=UPI00027B3E31|nr:hypothetical protein [Mycoplasmoides genitalium]AFQ03598.1 hypothetical protein CM3_01755 [Mycoplasmoides genitalium M6282]
MRFKKRFSLDWILKIGTILGLVCLGLFGVIFGSYKLLNDSRLGAVFNGSTTTTVYFLNHKSTNNTSLDPQQTKPTNGIENITNIDSFLDGVEKSYANSLFIQGFSSVNITKNTNDKTASELDNIDKSWLVNGGLPSVTLTFEQNREQAKTRQRKRQVDAQVRRNAISSVEHNYQLSLETTDGVVLFDSLDNNFINASIRAVVPQNTSVNSALTFEYKLNKNVVTKESLHTDFLDFINSKNLSSSDYNTGNGQASVEGNGKFFKQNANGTSSSGNKTLVLWKDKQGALNYVRNIFNVVEGSSDYLTFNEREKSLWEFLHTKGSFASGDNLFLNTDANGASPIKKASDITLKNLYYIYAAPNHFSAVASNSNDNNNQNNNNNNNSSDVITVSNSADTRKLRSADSSGFSGLFHNYIISEIRTEDPVSKTGDPVKINPTLQSFLDTNNQRIEYGGNIKFQVGNFLSSDGTYTPPNFVTAATVKELLTNPFPTAATIATAKTSLVNAPLANTITDVSNFASSFIAFGIIVLIAAVLLTLRYKLLGLYKALALGLSVVSSLVIFSAVGGVVDVFSFVGIFFVIAINLINLLSLGELFLRNIRNNASIIESWKLCLKRSFFANLEFHITWLISALVVIYLSNYQVQQLANLMAISAITSYFFSYGISIVLISLFVSSESGANWKLFLYQKDAKALTKTSSNYSLLSSTSDLNTDFFITKNQHDFFLKNNWKFLFVWLILLAIGVVMLVLYLVQPNLLGEFLAADVESSNGIIAGIGIVSLLYLAYCLIRYGVAYCLSYLVSFILLCSGLFAVMYLTNYLFSIDQSTIQLITFVYLFWLFFAAKVSQTTTWTYFYWFKRSLKDKVFIKNLFNDNFNSQWKIDLIESSSLVFIFIIYSGFNFGGIDGNFNLVIFYLIAIVGLFDVATAFLPMFCFGLINGWLSPFNYVHSRLSLKHKKHPFKEIDQIEEQLIAGINSF